MPFRPKPTKKKVQAVYKTLYISEAPAAQVEALAKWNDTSFNNVVISMIEYCLGESASDKIEKQNWVFRSIQEYFCENRRFQILN